LNFYWRLIALREHSREGLRFIFAFVTDSPIRTPRFWITLAICAVVYMPSLFWSFGLDQNIFAEIGSMMLHSARLYVDAWDVKPPNIFYTYAAFQWLFGQNEFAIRFSDYIASIAACAAMYVFVRRATSVAWAPELASILLALTLLSLGLSDTAQTESYSLVFIIAAAAMIFSQRSSRYLMAGAMISVATFYKTTSAVFLLPLIVEMAIRRRNPVRETVLLLVGFAGWCMLQVGLLATEGSLAEYWRITLNVFHHHPQEVSHLTVGDIARALWTYLDIWILLALAAIGIALVRREQVFTRSIRLPLLLCVSGLAIVWVQNKGWGYQYVIVLPGLISLCAICAVYLFIRIRTLQRVAATGVVALFAVAVLVLSPSAHRRIHYTKDALKDREQYIQSLGQPHSLYYPACTGVLINYLHTHTTANDEVFIFGEEPGAYWRAQRKPATRFVYALLFTSGVIPIEDLTAMQDTLVAKIPLVIAIERFDTLSFLHHPVTSESLVNQAPLFRPLKNLLSSYYSVVDTVCENFVIYRRK